MDRRHFISMMAGGGVALAMPAQGKTVNVNPAYFTAEFEEVVIHDGKQIWRLIVGRDATLLPELTHDGKSSCTYWGSQEMLKGVSAQPHVHDRMNRYNLVNGELEQVPYYLT